MHAKSPHGPYSSAWDKLAQCESSGNWSINTGNGYYGGLQFSKSSWEWVGGSGLPHQASKQEQITRAYELWKHQGWGAWPSCKTQLNLQGDPGGWGDSYYAVHPSASTVSHVSSTDQWTASFSVPLREEPSTSAEKLVQIQRGTTLSALERRGDWIRVEYTHAGDSYTGWVSTGYITQA